MSVYFIENIVRRHVKIGHSKDPKRRLTELSTGWSDAEVKLRATIPGASHEERVLHGRFYAQRLRGEWFDIDDELNGVIVVAERFGSLDSLEWFRNAVMARLAAYEGDRVQERQESVWLARNIRCLRQRAHLTQKDLASVAEVPRSTVANLESAVANPTLSVLLRISEALNVQLPVLISEPKE